MKKFILYLGIGAVSSLFPFIFGVVLGFTTYTLWAFLMTISDKPTIRNSLFNATFSVGLHMFLLNNDTYYLLFSLPSIVLAAGLVYYLEDILY